MRKILIIISILINITAHSQSVKDFSIGKKLDNGRNLEETEYGFSQKYYSTTVGNLINVELKAIANKDTIVYKIAFYEANCRGEEMAKEFRLAVQKNYSIKFNATKSKTETINNAFTNYTNLTITKYERICNVDNIKYTLITTKKTTINPYDVRKKMIFWQVSFIIIDTDIAKQQEQYSKKQEQLKKENSNSNF